MRSGVAFALALALAALPALAGCVDVASDVDPNPMPASDQIGHAGWTVRNSDFYWSYETREESFTDQFPWKDPAGAAGVEVNNGLHAGHVRVALVDAAGATVWSRTFRPGEGGGSWTTGAGKAGAWSVLLDRTNATGQFDVHVWMRTAT
jgi:hypothetical protein